MRTYKFALYFIIPFLLIFANKSFGQYTIKGQIFDSDNTNIPISFTTIQVLSTDKKLIAYGITNNKGYYNISVKKSGEYILKITHISFLTKEVSLVLSKKNTEVTKNILLKKNTESLDEIILKVDPKILEINTDTITYNLKRLTNGTESSLAEVLDKLPGVQLNSTGQITVNGKQVNKLLIDGEELFKSQHRITSESITSEMIKGIRYLDKYKDFGNIKNFNNKQIRALEISVKDRFKNKITGDVKVSGGIQEKALAHTNLFRLGGKLKVGFIGDWNNLGSASITSNEYNRLTTLSNENNLNTKGFRNSNFSSTPVFLDESLDIAHRTNAFGALSLIYKPSEKTKISLLNIINQTNQNQRLLVSRSFFDDQNTSQLETREVNGDFFLQTTSLEFGYQPNEQNFFSYTFNYIPSDYLDDIFINSTIADLNSTIFQQNTNKVYILDQKLNYSGAITKKTLLSLTGVFSKKNTDNTLSINASEPFLGLTFQDGNNLNQVLNLEETRIGYELKTTTKLSKKSSLESYQGIFGSEDSFTNEVVDQNQFNDDITTDRVDSYLGVRFRGTLSEKMRLRTELEYRYLSFERLDEAFENKYFLPSINVEYNIKNSKRLDFGYSYDLSLPKSISINQSDIVADYFSKIANSVIPINNVFPEHQFNTSYFDLNSSTGASSLFYISHTITPEFIARNSFFDSNNITNIQKDIGKNRKQTNIGINVDGRIKKLKLKIFSKTNASYSIEENKINFLDNTTKTWFVKERAGIYSRFRKGINFSTGIDIEYINFRNSINLVETTSITTKLYLYLNGNFYDKKIIWSFGGEYAFYKTDLDQTEIFNLKPSLKYKITNNWELSLTGNNILNIENSNIATNINTTNYIESRISQTLEGYLIFGIYYLIK